MIQRAPCSLYGFLLFTSSLATTTHKEHVHKEDLRAISFVLCLLVTLRDKRYRTGFSLPSKHLRPKCYLLSAVHKKRKSCMQYSDAQSQRDDKASKVQSGLVNYILA
jgi:hypothetical protein